MNATGINSYLFGKNSYFTPHTKIKLIKVLNIMYLYRRRGKEGKGEI